MAAVNGIGISPQQLRPQRGTQAAAQQGAQAQSGANPVGPVDQTNISREAQEAGGAQGAQQGGQAGAQLTQALSPIHTPWLWIQCDSNPFSN